MKITSWALEAPCARLNASVSVTFSDVLIWNQSADRWSHLRRAMWKCHRKCGIDWCPECTDTMTLLQTKTFDRQRCEIMLDVTNCYDNKGSSSAATCFSLSSNIQIRVKREDGPQANSSSLRWAPLWLVLPLERSVHCNAGRFLLKWALDSNLPEIGCGVEELTVAVTAVWDQRASWMAAVGMLHASACINLAVLIRFHAYRECFHLQKENIHQNGTFITTISTWEAIDQLLSSSRLKPAHTRKYFLTGCWLVWTTYCTAT